MNETSQSVVEDVDNESCSLLVTGPHCIAEVDDAVAVEGAMLQPVIVPVTPRKNSVQDSHFGAEEENMQELEDRSGITHVVQNGGSEPAGGFDVCNEYGYNAYSADDYEDDGEEANDPSVEVPSSMGVSTVKNTLEDSASSQELSYKIYLLGKHYDPLHDYAPRRSDETTLFWFTYRFDFPEIVPYRITTDAGWGCMLRSAQMMLGQALRMHYKSRTWRPPQAISQRRHERFMVKIMTWFADYPSKSECIFSLHNMVAAGLAKYETLPGEWYGPSKASYVMRDLCQLYEERQAKVETNGDSDLERPIFRVHVAPQGTVYRDSVNELMTKSQHKDPAEEGGSSSSSEPQEPVSHPLDPIYSSPAAKEPMNDSLPWDTSLLLLVPLRLGLQNFNQDYTVQLAHMFSFTQSVGVLGGRPRGARWFYGATSDGVKLYGLDPHTIQACPDRRRTRTAKGQVKSVVSLTDDYLRSVHTTNPECINLNRLDPSLALGFYCRDRDDFNNLCDALQNWKTRHPKLPDIFTVAEHVPNYSADVSSVMNEMMTMSVGDALGEEENEQAGDDEDEYVLL